MKTIANPIKMIHRTIVIILVMSLVLFAGAYGQKSVTILYSNGNSDNFRHFIPGKISTGDKDISYIYLHGKDIKDFTLDESAMDLETWMTDSQSWMTESDSYSNDFNTVEEDIKVEDWMLKKFLTNKNINEKFLNEIDEEEKMVIEDWMINTTHWTIKD